MTSGPGLGIALGGGGARGYAHIGVLLELDRMGIHPAAVAGTSMGAVIGAVYLSGELERVADESTGLSRWDMVRFLDVDLTTTGGLIEGRRVLRYLRETFGDRRIEDLPRRYGVVAADLDTGGEVWLREGKIWDAVRASISIPGIFTPVEHGDGWLVDGGVVNPVPVSLVNALGASRVIAVDVLGGANRQIAGDRQRRAASAPFAELRRQVADQLSEVGQNRMISRLSQLIDPNRPPGMYDVLTASLAAMQARITESRLAEAPPALVLRPDIAGIETLEFDRAEEAIAAGRAAVEANRGEIERIAAG